MPEAASSACMAQSSAWMLPDRQQETSSPPTMCPPIHVPRANCNHLPRLLSPFNRPSANHADAPAPAQLGRRCRGRGRLTQHIVHAAAGAILRDEAGRQKAKAHEACRSSQVCKGHYSLCGAQKLKPGAEAEAGSAPQWEGLGEAW